MYLGQTRKQILGCLKHICVYVLYSVQYRVQLYFGYHIFSFFQLLQSEGSIPLNDPAY